MCVFGIMKPNVQCVYSFKNVSQPLKAKEVNQLYHDGTY